MKQTGVAIDFVPSYLEGLVEDRELHHRVTIYPVSQHSEYRTAPWPTERTLRSCVCLTLSARSRQQGLICRRKFARNCNSPYRQTPVLA